MSLPALDSSDTPAWGTGKTRRAAGALVEVVLGMRGEEGGGRRG